MAEKQTPKMLLGQLHKTVSFLGGALKVLWAPVARFQLHVSTSSALHAQSHISSTTSKLIVVVQNSIVPPPFCETVSWEKDTAVPSVESAPYYVPLLKQYTEIDSNVNNIPH